MLLLTVSNTVICKLDVTFVCEREAKGEAVDQFIPIFSHKFRDVFAALLVLLYAEIFMKRERFRALRSYNDAFLRERKYAWAKKNRKIVFMKYRRII